MRAFYEKLDEDYEALETACVLMSTLLRARDVTSPPSNHKQRSAELGNFEVSVRLRHTFREIHNTLAVAVFIPSLLNIDFNRLYTVLDYRVYLEVIFTIV